MLNGKKDGSPYIMVCSARLMNGDSRLGGEGGRYESRLCVKRKRVSSKPSRASVGFDARVCNVPENGGKIPCLRDGQSRLVSFAAGAPWIGLQRGAH